MNILLPFFRVLIDADGKIVDMDGDYYDLTQEGSEAVLEELVSAATASEEKVGDLRDYNLRYYRSGARKWSYGKTPDLKFTGGSDRRRPNLRPRMARSSSSWISPPRSRRCRTSTGPAS